MNLIGNKILLIEIRNEDLDFFNNPEIEKNVVGWSKPVTMNEQINWFQNLKNDPNIRFMIVNINDTEIYGTGIISKIDYKNKSCNLNIKLDPNFHGKGIGTESIAILVKYSFEELNLNRITANILEYNIGSQKIFEKNGFIKEGIQRKAIYKCGKYNDLYNYGLIKEDYYNEGNR